MRTWDELHIAAKKLYQSLGHTMLAGNSVYGLCADHNGVHGVLDGLVFGNNMESVTKDRQLEVDQALKRLGY